MRNPILGIAIAIAFAASSQSALADQKKPKDETKPTVVKDTTNMGILVGRTKPTKTGTGPTRPTLPTTGRHQ
jgi:hypothetical protein